MSNLITIFVRDFEILMSVGIYPAEKAERQRVIVNIEAECVLPDVLKDEIDQVVSYEDCIHIVENLGNQRHYNLLEVFAEDIREALFQDKRIQALTVSCEKPDIFQGNPKSVGVRLSVQR